MKKSRLLSMLCTAVFGVTTQPSQAALTYVLGSQAVYDDVADLSWTTNANINGLMTWEDANTWATNLEIDGVGGWRLPTTLQPDATCDSQYDPGGGLDLQGYGTGCTGSEMGNLTNVVGVTAATPGMFSDVQPGPYWSSTEYAPDTTGAWVRTLNGDYQYVGNKNDFRYAWAVQSGNVGEVPLPAAVWLFGSGLIGFVGLAKHKKAA